MMVLDKLRVNQLSAEGWAWYQRYLAVLDAYDLAGYTGIDPVAAGRGAFGGSITGMGYRLVHEPLNIYGDDHRFVLEPLNHYVRDADGGEDRPITVRATAWTDRHPDGLVQSVRLYQDMSPVDADSPPAEQG